MNSNSHIHQFWAKSDRKNPTRIHLLEHHLADVGACFEALVNQPTFSRQLAHTAKQDDVDEVTAARLCVFAALHDIGKVNLGFQTQIWSNADFPPGTRKPNRAGHTVDLTPVLRDEDSETAGWFFDALGWWDDLLQWDDQDGATVCSLLVATLSHHGRPLQLDDTRQPNPAIWRSLGSLDLPEYTRRIGRLVREWFPKAFTPAGTPLPSAPAFQHHFLGLCNLADWIGSNEQWFPYVDTQRGSYIDDARRRAERAIADIGLNLRDQRAAFSGVNDFTELFDLDGKPNAIQRTSHDAPLGAPLVIIESETGSGKTEAALWRFTRMYEAGLVDGLYFALPTRAAAVQIHGRVQRFVANLFPKAHQPVVVMAVPGYDPGTNAETTDITMAEYDGHAAGHPEDDKPWAAENPKRYMAAQIAVGTVDQTMLGSLKVKNAHMRAASLARNLLVVDEVHASDTYMSEILSAVLDAHIDAGGYAMLMSATLGSVARQRWLGTDHATALTDAVATAYPAVSTRNSIVDAGENGQAKTVSMESRPIMREPSSIARIARDAACVGAKVLVIRNTVDYAVNTWRAVAEAADDDLSILLHHGRYAAGDRKYLDGCVEAMLGKDNRPDGGCVAVGTQTLEQSLDIDADLLITDLCPADVLLQRIGRLHRHRRNKRPADYATPQCIVLTPPDDDLQPLLDSRKEANGLGPHGGVYEDLRILQATLNLIVRHPQWSIPEMNRMLVEGATHPSELEAIEETGDAWKDHGIKVRGGEISDWQTAHNAIIRRDKSFFEDNREVLFPSNEERIRTRLGDDRVDVAFSHRPASPFESDGVPPIGHVAVSIQWLDKSTDTPESVNTTVTDDGFEFAIGSRGFRYNRMGLQRL